MQHKPLIQINHLTKKFGDNVVLNDISETIDQGDVIVVIGASGGGKSTFLRSLNLLNRPTAGEILLKEQTWLILAKSSWIMSGRKWEWFSRASIFSRI